MLVCGAGVFAVWFVLRFAAGALGAAEPDRAAILSIWYGCLIVLFAAWIRGVSAKGPRLLDCGPHPMWWLFLANVALYILFLRSDMSLNGTMYFTITFCAFWGLMATGRLSLHENGIWTYWSLLPWEKIQSYSWSGERTLMIETGPAWRRWFLQSAIPVPPDRVAGFARILEERVPAGNASAAVSEPPSGV